MKRSPLTLQRQLFGSLANSAFTLALFALLVWAGWGVLSWAFGSAQWLVLRANAATLTIGRYPDAQEWRLWLLLGMLTSLAGVSWGRLRGLNNWPLNDRIAALLFVISAVLLPWLLAFGAINQLRLIFLLLLLLLLRQWSGGAWSKAFGKWWALVWGITYVFGLWLIAGGFGLPAVRPSDWGGLVFTLLITSLTLLLALPFGVLLALGRRSGLLLVRWVCVAVIELIRGAPLITLLFVGQNLVGFLSPNGFAPDRVWRATGVLTVFAAAYLAEAVRGGLNSIPMGQQEAARSLGLSSVQTMGLVVLPQALKIALPALGGQFISLLQDTTLLSIVGLFDLLGIARSVLSNPDWLGRYAEVYLFLAVLYWCSCAALALGSRALEKRLATNYS